MNRNETCPIGGVALLYYRWESIAISFSIFLSSLLALPLLLLLLLLSLLLLLPLSLPLPLPPSASLPTYTGHHKSWKCENM